MRLSLSLHRCVFALLLVAIPRMALSLPPVQFESGTDGDSTVSLSLLQEAIVGDAVSWCELRIEVAGAGGPLDGRRYCFDLGLGG